MSPWISFPSLRALMAPIIQSGLPFPSSPAVLTGGARAPTGPSCTASVFSALSVVGGHVQIHSLDATAHTGLAVDPDLGLPPTTCQQIASADVCLLTINYTHPDEETAPVVTTWVGLPLAPSSWNGRFLMNGGGGWLAGDQARVVSAVASGYASASTNAGHNGTTGDAMPTWGLTSDGAVNGPALEDFASRAIVEAVRFGKAATDLYFGAKPEFSYWNGCSTGGRQGHGNCCSSIPPFLFFFFFLADAEKPVVAEKIPGEFSGILAGAPAISWAKFLVQEAWGYVVASEYGSCNPRDPNQYARMVRCDTLRLGWTLTPVRLVISSYAGLSPPPCVFEALQDAAIAACDELDGVKDGVIALPGLCNFDPSSLVGSDVECSDFNTSITMTEDLANLARNIWSGPSTPDGKSLWYGM